MNDDRLNRRLADLSAFIDEADYLTSKGRSAYLADDPEGRLLRNAGERILIKIATVAEKLPAEYKDAHPAADWRGLKRMRDLAAHHYDKVNDELVWQALAIRIPRLRADLGLSL